MKPASALAAPSGSADHARALNWVPFMGVLLFAAAVRALGYTGYFGSDEVTYTESAFQLLRGDWSVSAYVGANRYGVNLPVAAFAWLLGPSEFSAALYSLLCSIGEVGLVTWFGARMLGQRAGLLAGIVLATLPIHVHFAGRLMADAPLGLAITASFLFFWDGEVNRRRLSYFIAGLAAGWSFWVKPQTVFFLVVFLTFPLVFRTLNPRWLWMVLGFALVILLNGVFFHVLTDNFWFVIHNMAERRAQGGLTAAVATGTTLVQPGYYLGYLFGKVYHTWLLGYLAAAAVVRWWLVCRRSGAAKADALPFVLWWAAGLLLIFSLLVVRLSPLTFVPKQTNYMLIFAAPLAMLAGWVMSHVRGAPGHALTLVVAIPAVLLSLLAQASVAVFTANSKATVQFALERPQALFFVNTNAYRAAVFHAVVHPEAAPAAVRPIGEWNKAAPSRVPDVAPRRERYAIVDTETIAWAKSEPFRRLQDRPACWVPEGVLTPQLFGAGVAMVNLLRGAVAAVPTLAHSGLAVRLTDLASPSPAHVFRIPDEGC